MEGGFPLGKWVSGRRSYFRKGRLAKKQGEVQRITEHSLIEQGLTSGYRLLLIITILLSVATLAAFAVLYRATRQLVPPG